MTTHEREFEYNCTLQGCFNDMHRLKFKTLNKCLPGSCCFTDIDAITEVNGHFLLLEMKHPSGRIPDGQSILFKQMTKSNKYTVVVAFGKSAEDIDGFCIYSGGAVAQKYRNADADELKRVITLWGEMAVGRGFKFGAAA